MIDTDKYEGHTPGPWKQAKPKNSNPRIITQFCDDEIIVNTGATSWEADIQLIADAPLLLAEVKRLRMYEVAWKILYDNAIEEGRETRTRTWKEIMELVRCDVREMVDTGDAVFDEWAKRTIGGFE